MRVHHESIGSGLPVLFVHAGIADSRMWDPQFRVVPDGINYVRLDLQGFGQSEFGGEPFSYHGDVLSVMDELSIESAVLVGCSIGAAVVLGVAEAAPNRVLAMVLVGADAPSYEPPEGPYEPPEWPEAVKAFQSGDMRRVAELDAEMWVVGHGRSIEDVDRRVYDLVIEMDQAALQSEAAREEMRVPPDLSSLPDIDGPTLVMVGEYDLPDLRSAAGHLAENLSDRDPAVIPDAAHLPSLEKPEIFNSILDEFLQSLA